MRFDQLRRLDLGRRRADHRAAHADLDLLDVGVLALPAGQHAFGIVRLDPALEEARRHRQMRGVDLDALQVHAGEPALENVLADFGAELFFHSQPTLLIRACHFLFSEVGWLRRNSVKRTAVIPLEPLRAVTSLKRKAGGWAEGGSLVRSARAGGGRAQPLDGTDLPFRVGSPAARNSRIFSSALAFGEKSHRSSIIPPSPIAMPRNGCVVSVLLKYKDLYFGVPIPTPQHSRRSEAESPHQALSLHWMSRDYPVTVLFFSSSMSLITSSPLNSRALGSLAKIARSPRAAMAIAAQTQMWPGFWRHSACCEVRANCGQGLESTWRLSVINL